MYPDPFILTHSKNECYQNCPRQFWLLHGTKYVYGKPEIPFKENEYTQKGKLVHSLMETAILSIDDSFYKTISVQNTLWQPWWGDLLNILWHKYNLKAETKIGIDMKAGAHILGDYYRPKQPLGPLDSPLFIQGAIDLIGFNKEISHKAMVIDWKTGKPGNSSSRQLAIYAMFVMLTWKKIEEVKARYIYLYYENANDPGDFMTFTRQDLLWMKKQVKEDYFKIAEALDMKKFDPKENKLCRFCPATKEQCHKDI